MRKVVIHRPGGHDRLLLEQHPDPSPRPGEVRIDVAYAGVNYADCLVRMGLYKSSRDQVGWPVTPGFEVAGQVGAVGDGVDDLEVGDRVFAVTLFGGYSTSLVVARRQVFQLPPVLSLEQAAAVPAIFLTAYYGLLELARPRVGDTMLVHSAAGGVGGALVQLGKVAGCRVVGVVGAPHKLEVASRAGADEVIDKSSQDLWSVAECYAPRGYDLVFDANGVATLGQSYRHLARPGKLVVYGFHSMLSKGRSRPNPLKLLLAWWRTPRFDPLRLSNRNHSILAFNLSYLFDQADRLAEMMTQIVAWLEAGQIVPPPVETCTFEAVSEAHAALESGQTVGKLVLKM